MEINLHKSDVDSSGLSLLKTQGLRVLLRKAEKESGESVTFHIVPDDVPTNPAQKTWLLDLLKKYFNI